MKNFGIYMLFLCVLTGCSGHDPENKNSHLTLASENLESKNFIRTLSILRNIKDDDLKTKEYYLMQGLSFFKVGDYREAIVSFEKAKPKSMELKIYVAYLHLLLGDAEHAIFLAKEIEAQFGPKPEVYILNGNIALKRKHFDKAEKYYHLALKQKEDFTKGYIGLANVFLLQRNFIKAEENYLKAVFLSKDQPIVYIALAKFYISMNRYKDAENNLKIALKIDPNNINVLMLLSTVYIKTNDHAGASEIFKEALDLHPNSLDLRIRAIKTYLRMNKLDEAYPMIQSLQNHEEGNYDGLILMGEYFLRKNNLDRALSHFNKALIINGNSHTVNYYLGLIHLIQNKVRLSKQFLEKSITNYPGFVDAHLLLAMINLSMKQYRIASAHSNLVLQLDPKNISAHAMNSIALYLEGNLKEAQYELDVMKRVSPTNALVPFLNAVTAIDNKDFVNAKNEVSKIDFIFAERLFLDLELFRITGSDQKEIDHALKPYIDHKPGFLAFNLISNFYMINGNFVAASLNLEESLRLNTNNVVTYYYLSEMESSRGNLEVAISYLKKAIEINPFFMKSHQALGVLYEKVKDFKNAKSTYENGLTYFPEDSMLLNNLAWILLVHFQDKTSAYPYIRKAAGNAPGDGQVSDTLAWWYYLNHEYQKAISILSDVVDNNPGNGLYQFHLGMAYFKNDEIDLADTHLKNALKFDIDKKYRRKIMRTLH